MISDDVQRIELDARRRSLDEYKLRCQDLRGENDALKVEKDQRETDALQIISFLRRDAERKDELIESLKNTINQQRDLFAQQREEERQQAADTLQEKEAEWGAKETQMQSQLDHLGNELDALQTFKEQKTSLEEKLEQGNLERSDMEADHKEMLAAIERKFFEEKGRLAKEYKQMLAEMKKSSQEEAVERLDASTKKILFENRRMAEELRVQVRPARSPQPAHPAARTPPQPAHPTDRTPRTPRTAQFASTRARAHTDTPVQSNPPPHAPARRLTSARPVLPPHRCRRRTSCRRRRRTSRRRTRSCGTRSSCTSRA